LAFLIVIEGIDGSGKGTQAALLSEGLQQSGTATTLFSFPRYEHTFFGKAIGEFLNGTFGTLDEVNPFLASLLYAGDRFESRSVLAKALETSEVVVLDRYVPSNIAHQGAKLDGESRHELIEQIRHVEFEIYSLPCPDLVLLLDLPADEAGRLIAKKQARSYTDKKADLQEADGGYLAKVRNVYQQLAADDPAWVTIECLRDKRLRSIEEISEEIFRVVDERRLS
jgi:dTMP kinase